MKLLLVVDAHLIKTPDGKVWSSTIYDYTFFARYLSVFDEVRVATRISHAEDNSGYPRLCSGKGLEFYMLPDYRGPREYASKYKAISREMKKCVEGCDCAIFRVPSTLGYKIAKAFKKTGKPYAIEVVVDPWDFAAPGTMKNLLRPLIRVMWTVDLKKICLSANGVSYVTEKALQKRYPSRARKSLGNRNYFESFYSSIDLPTDYFSSKKTFLKKKYIDMVHVSNNIGNYVKGHKEIIEAVSILKERGIDSRIDFIGEGPLVDEFISFAKKLGVEERVNFIGRISDKNKMKKELQKHDLFVFPSHAEGLPRSLIEAMALGLPCVATRINGIPELLSEKYLVPVGDSYSLADKIQTLYSDYESLKKAGRSNQLKAREYSSDKLSSRRKEFYTKLRRISEK